MRTHWQNLNERPDGTTGAGWKHGRAWLYLRAEGRAAMHAEWGVRRGFEGGARVTLAGRDSEGEDVLVGLFFGWAFLYLGFDLPWFPRRAGDGRSYALYYDAEGDAVHWSWGANEWGDGRPSWRSRCWFVRDVLFGRAAHRTTVLRVESTAIPMPERSYPATVTLQRMEWKRPRWPWPRVGHYAYVDIPGGVGVPGKGENAWDCGDDAIYGLSREATTVEQAVAATVESALRTRRRYGGREWTPQPATP